MHKHQQGQTAVMVIAAVVAAAAFAGLWTYCSIQLKALRSDVKAKDAVIETMTKEKAECEGSKSGLKAANESWLGQVNACKLGLAEVQKERNARDLEARAAKAEAQRQSLVYKKSITDILNANAGIDWCKTWDKMVTDYTVMRQQSGVKP